MRAWATSSFKDGPLLHTAETSSSETEEYLLLPLFRLITISMFRDHSGTRQTGQPLSAQRALSSLWQEETGAVGLKSCFLQIADLTCTDVFGHSTSPAMSPQEPENAVFRVRALQVFCIEALSSRGSAGKNPFLDVHENDLVEVSRKILFWPAFPSPSTTSWLLEKRAQICTAVHFSCSPFA